MPAKTKPTKAQPANKFLPVDPVASKLAQTAETLWQKKHKLAIAEGEFAKKWGKLAEEINEMTAALQFAMQTAKLESVASVHATASLKHTEIAELTDEHAFFEYIQRERAWDLVQKRPHLGACRVRWDDNIQVPGIARASRVSLQLSDRKKGK